MEDWDNYRITNDNMAKIETVHHVAHIPTAMRIIEDGRLAAGLVKDESLLNESRINVNWLSANVWAYGPIYGSVSFSFNWTELVKNYKFYWVECMEKYNPPAFRFLLSKRDIKKLYIRRYDPESHNGPLVLSKNEWYYNRTMTSEFMVEDELSLDHVAELSFVKHNQNFCSLNDPDCEERAGKYNISTLTAARLLAHTLATRQNNINRLWKISQPDDFSPLNIAYMGLSFLFVKSNKAKFGGPLENRKSCYHIVMSALSLHCINKTDEARNVLSLLKSKECFLEGLSQIIRQHFNEPSWSFPSY